MFNIAGNGAGGYNINNSLRFRSNASAASTAYFTRTPASNTNRTTWTWSSWVKRAFISSSGETTLFGSTISSSDRILISFYQDKLNIYGISSGTAFNVNSTAVYRDPSAWYHVVVVFDSTQATSSNRIKLYINGIQITSFGTSTYPNLNQSLAINSTNQHQIGRHFDGTSQVNFMDGYLAEVNFIDGQALTPSSFGATDAITGVWQPSKYTGTYGTNGFYLNFSDTSALTTASNAGLGKDWSGNTNYWNTTNISVTSGVTYDAMTDSPTNTSETVGNYPVLNPVNPAQSGVTISYGNLRFTNSNGSTATNASSTFGEITGAPIIIAPDKYYFEATDTLTGTGSVASAEYVAVGNKAYRRNGQDVGLASYGASYTTGDVIGVAVDRVAGTVTFYKNNVSQGAQTGGNPSGNIAVYGYSGNIWDINFGQRPFVYTPPSGYVRLNTYNLPTPTVLQGNKVMDATTYTGTGATQSITNAGSFTPDLVWIKSRTSSIHGNQITDSVRGVTKNIKSNSTAAEVTDTNGLTAFNSNGFTIGSDAGYNTSGNSIVGWQWQAGQGSTSSNTNGSITSTVSVNTTAGFSIVTYTGTGANATVGHGLGVAPSFIICKNRGTTQDWAIYHSSLGNTQFLIFTTATAGTSSAYWNNTSPTSSVFTVGTQNRVNANTMVAYCWAEITGFSKFGSYAGNGSSDGTFIYLGFRPKFIMVKKTSATGNWEIFDSSRNTSNLTNLQLLPNLSNAESTSTTGVCDLVSNGVKWRGSGGDENASGATYIYAAFAENPFKYSNAR